MDSVIPHDSQNIYATFMIPAFTQSSCVSHLTAIPGYFITFSMAEIQNISKILKNTSLLSTFFIK